MANLGAPSRHQRASAGVVFGRIVHAPKAWPEGAIHVAAGIALDIVRGLHFLHASSCIHRDVKSAVHIPAII